MRGGLVMNIFQIRARGCGDSWHGAIRASTLLQRAVSYSKMAEEDAGLITNSDNEITKEENWQVTLWRHANKKPFTFNQIDRNNWASKIGYLFKKGLFGVHSWGGGVYFYWITNNCTCGWWLGFSFCPGLCP